MGNIILGSAGWRSKYAGKDHILSNAEVKALLEEISDSGIKHIDTAPSYGDAEEIILQWADKTTKIDTKLIAFDGLNDFQDQINKLGSSIDRVNTIYFHDPEIVQKSSHKELVLYYEEIKKIGCNMGFSLYDIESLRAAYAIFPNNNDVLFQVPINILDLKFIKFIKKNNVEFNRIVARSIFSRGLIFLDNSKISSCFPDNFINVKESFEKIYKKPFIQQHLFKLTFSLINFLHKNKIKTLFGINSIEEINSIIENINKNYQMNFDWDDMIYQSQTINKIEALVL